MLMREFTGRVREQPQPHTAVCSAAIVEPDNRFFAETLAAQQYRPRV